MIDFSGKHALITGAGSGIGRATVEVFHKLGAKVVAGDLNLPALESLGKSIDPRGERFEAVKYDASKSEDAAALVAAATKRFGKLDALVANAGIYEEQPAQSMTDEQWRRMLSVNLDGVFYITQRSLAALNDGGAIVTVASIAAHQGGSVNLSHYGASKGGVLAYTRSLARDVAPRIRCNCVSPGTIETPMTVKMVERGGQAFIDRIPVRRLGKPSEIASVIAFLASDAASFVVGETIIASGGAYMG